MDYETTFTNYYNRYYSLFEYRIKRYYIDKNSQNRTFNHSFNQLAIYLSNNFKDILNHKSLLELYDTFNKKHELYASDQIQAVLKNEVKEQYDKIDLTELPPNYNFLKFIKSIAFIEAKKEISIVMGNLDYYNFLHMMFQLNDFEKFEIKEYRNTGIAGSAIFKELHSRLYPPSEDSYEEFENPINELSIENKLSTQQKVILVDMQTSTETKCKKIKADIIFKEEYIGLFHHIVESYSDKKNKAFFSYLYHYFSENKFLLKNLKSSLTYNRYLIENDFIDSFSKVIQKTNENSEEEKRMFVIFKKAYDEFILFYFEGNLKEI